VADRPLVLALNKVDRLPPGTVPRIAGREGVPISAATGEGVAALLAALAAALPPVRALSLRIPHGEGAALALCYEAGRVLARAEDAEAVRLEVEVPARLLAPLARWVVPSPAAPAAVLD